MTRDMNTTYGQDIWNYGAGTLRNCGEGFFHFLRFTAVLLLMVVGVSGVKAQTGPVGTDFSGFYYIANYTGDNGETKGYDVNTPETNYYLCPARPAPDAGENYFYGAIYYDYDVQENGKQQPYLTTYKTGRVEGAAWKVEFATTISDVDYYYIRCFSDNNKYLTHNTSRAEADTRFTVHLQATAGTNNESLFCFEPDENGDGSYYIRTQKKSSNHRHINPATGNKNSYYGTGASNKKTKINNTEVDPGGMIGYWSATGKTGYASRWYLEKVQPIISYNSSNLIEISYPYDDTATIYYTTDGNDPPITGTDCVYDGAPFDPEDGVTTIKAIAVSSDGYVSGIATYEPPFFLGSTHPRLIQSQHYNNNDVTWTEPYYFMIPSDKDASDNITVNTSTLLQPTMEWYFLNAGVEGDVQYYYIVNNSAKDNESHPYYLCYDSGVLMQVFDSENANKFKFSIAPYPTTGTPTDYNLLPYGLTSGNRFINKNSGNKEYYQLNLGNTNSASASRWKFIKKTDLNTTPPFSVSDANNIYYYKLSTNSTPTAFITPPASGNYVTTNTTESTNQNWYFEQAEAATSSDWLTYYHIRNAITGEYLYYNGEVNSSQHSNAFELHSNIGSEADRYKFAMARAIKQDRWYIIPKVLKETQFANISTIWRDNNNALKTQATRNNGNAMWQFTESAFCMPLEFTESEGNITLTCATKGAEIHYTTDGTTPDGTTANVVSESTSWASSGQHRIKAIAVVKSGETITASSAVVTLLNKPDVTLEAGPYTYKDAAWEPAVTKVSIGESGSETDAGIDPATYTVTYSDDRTNVGTVTVTLEDKVEGDMYVWNASTTFNITQKAVTITADSDTKVYNGTALTKSTATATGLIEGHSLASVTVTGTQTVVGESNNVPSAAVIKKGEIDVTANYIITYENGKLTVTKRSLEITADSETKEYDGTALTKNSYTLTNNTALATGDAISSIIVTGSQTIVGESNNVPSAAVIKNGNGEGEDVTTCYNITYKNGTLKVTKKTLTITADSGEKVYDGTPLTKNSYTNTDLLSGDVLESVTVTGTQTDAGESDNVPSAAVIKNANSEVITESYYNVVYKNGKLKVTAKPVTITADSGEKEYDGTALTKNTYSHTALVEGHTITSVTITGTQTNVGTSNNVPSAAVIKKGETVVTANYSITYANGTLKITPAAATVTADAKTKVYGDAEPTYTATVTGLKNNEAASVLTYTFSRATGENVGEYTITPAGEATQGNYTVTYVTGKLTITKAAANVKADDKTKGYGDADPAFTATVTGLKNGDAASVLTYTFSRAEGENVNADGYTITPAGNAEQGNYAVTYATGKLTITPKAINDGTNPAEGIDVDITYDGGTNYTVVVKQGEKTLVKDTDYELPEGSENQYDDADGNHVITIKGKDGSNYTGSFKATYIKLTFWDTTPDQTLTSETTAAVYCATQNLKVNESFEAYYVTNLADNTLTLTKVEAGESKKNYIPANQPLLLICDAATAPKGFTVKPYTGTGTDLVDIPATGEGSNLLKVVTDAGGLAVALTQVYIFSQGEFVLTKAGTMSKGKFYLENPNYSTSAPSRSIIRITTEGTTGINSSQLSDTDSEIIDTWYTIGGQKLNNKPTRKGLYLQNGKKVVIK